MDYPNGTPTPIEVTDNHKVCSILRGDQEPSTVLHWYSCCSRNYLLLLLLIIPSSLLTSYVSLVYSFPWIFCFQIALKFHIRDANNELMLVHQAFVQLLNKVHKSLSIRNLFLYDFYCFSYIYIYVCVCVCVFLVMYSLLLRTLALQTKTASVFLLLLLSHFPSLLFFLLPHYIHSFILHKCIFPSSKATEQEIFFVAEPNRDSLYVFELVWEMARIIETHNITYGSHLREIKKLTRVFFDFLFRMSVQRLWNTLMPSPVSTYLYDHMQRERERERDAQKEKETG